MSAAAVFAGGVITGVVLDRVVHALLQREPTPTDSPKEHHGADFKHEKAPPANSLLGRDNDHDRRRHPDRRQPQHPQQQHTLSIEVLQDHGLSERSGFWFLEFRFACATHREEAGKVVLTNFKHRDSNDWTLEVTECAALGVHDRDQRLSFDLADAFVNKHELKRLRAAYEGKEPFATYLATNVVPLVLHRIQRELSARDCAHSTSGTGSIGGGDGGSSSSIGNDGDSDYAHRGQRRLFLSHPGSAKPLMRTLRNGLEFAGFHVWYDETDFLPGDQLWDTLERAIDDCEGFVAWIDADYLGSAWCRAELIVAHRLGKPIVPFGHFDTIEHLLVDDLAFVKDIAVNNPTDASVFRIITNTIHALNHSQ